MHAEDRPWALRESTLESPPSLSETLRRLEDLIPQQGLNRSDVLNPKDLAAETALPEASVRLLLKGRPVPDDTVNERVCTRLKAVAEAHMTRTRMRPSELAAELHHRLAISEYWARQICDGKKVPNIDLLHRLVRYFGIKAGEPFFTDSAEEALNRVLLPIQHRLEPEGDSLDALLARHGVVQTDLRMHGSLNPEQRKLLAGVLLSVLQEGDTKQ